MNDPRIIKKGKYYHIVITHEGKQINLKYLGEVYKILGITPQELAKKLPYTQGSIPKIDDINRVCSEVLSDKGSDNTC